MSGDGGRMDSGVAFGRARGGPGRTALASRFPHRPAARRASALEPRLAAWLGGEVRTAAVEALADLADPRAIGSIAGLLRDPVADVKRNALGALSHFDQAVPTAPVVALLDDPDADVRHEAIDLLVHLHARPA